ncbi:GNAT family N-acetyltransferase [Brevibacterium sp. UCMA 11752]|uniref:GNAT family N-acetyltransferase n=1 Tax=Brevibacterium sp. UCMA 11752 TaxID=2745946 RepID=UPI001F15ABEF|nr:GNAT family N-acetyltransferase [Brevibacterium sp. UCMA 11752]MCF2589072.1 GNAT family N-acetyltransferase [Brevibacterium sp. UCMA 11752]
MNVREARKNDLPDILRLVHALAVYEKEPDAVDATEDDFAAVMFPADGHPNTYGLVAEVEGQIIGIAIWFHSFSTWTGKNGIWLEDLFVDPDHRGIGAGKALLGHLAQICQERGLTRLEWCVLKWNEPSIGFYRSLGAKAQDEWETFRLDGQALHSFADESAANTSDADASGEGAQ